MSKRGDGVLVGVGVGVVVDVAVGVEVAVGVDVAVGVGVIVSVGVTVGVGVAIRLETALHPDNPGKSNKESNKMPAIKNTFFFILVSFRGSHPPNGLRFTCTAQRAKRSAGSACWAG